MAGKSGLSKDGSNMKAATGLAHSARTAKAGAFKGGTPPSGPKAEPSRLNGVPKVGGKGVISK